jgi:hypothetical protein
MRCVRVWGLARFLAAIQTHVFHESIFPVMPPIEWCPLDESNRRATRPQLGSACKLTWFELEHPGGSTGFRLDWPDRSLAYITDTIARDHSPYVDQLRDLYDAEQQITQAIHVKGAANDDLGTVDGFVVDRSSGRPYYVVVDSGGWFTGNRYLLPINAVHLDRPGRQMRTTLDKDSIKKYPEFDNAAFESSGDRGRQYEQRLLQTYVPGGNEVIASRGETWDYERYEQFRQPEWWITEGVAVTRRREPAGSSSPDRSSGTSTRERELRNPSQPGVPNAPTSEGRSTIDEPRSTNPDRSRRR